MADFREIPTPTYDYQIARLVDYYKKALRDIDAELNSLFTSDFSRASALAIEKEIAGILSELDDNAKEWVAENMPVAVEDGVLRSIVALGVVESLEEAKAIVKFNRLNRDLIATAVADTQSDLLQVTQNVDRKVRVAIRQVTAEVLRSNLTQGINATATLRRDIMRDLRKQLGDSLNTGIIDASGRRWKPQVYVEMVVKTKMTSAQREAAVNDGLSRGALYGVISRHNAIDACKFYEGKIVKLSRDADGDYPYYADLPRRDIWHPNCRHTISVLRNPETLPDDLKRLNNIE